MAAPSSDDGGDSDGENLGGNISVLDSASREATTLRLVEKHHIKLTEGSSTKDDRTIDEKDSTLRRVMG